MNPGQIVEFIEEGRAVIAVCLEERKTRVRALTEHQREVKLAPTRFTHISETRLPLNQSREALVRSMRERSSLREKLANEIDVRTLWEILHEEAGEYPPLVLAELAFGKEVDDDHVSAIIRGMLTDRVYFRFRVHGFRPNDPETVDKIITQRAREQEKEEQIQKGSQWIMAIQEGKLAPPPDGWEEVVELLKEYAIYGKGAPRYRQCEEILRRAGMNHPLAPFRILVRLGVWCPDENILLHLYGIRRTFPKAVLDDVKMLMGRIEISPPIDPSREEIQPSKTFTIDSAQTLDIDDALSLEPIPGGYQVGVHITDVRSVVPMDCPLDEEAFLRGTSLYLPDERIPMFPSEISEELCSLKENEVRPTVSLLMDVDEQGEVLSHRFSLARIRVNQRLSYEEADEILKRPSETLGWLYGIAKAWREARIRRGALLLPLPEVTLRIDTEGEILLERRDRESPAQILVSEMMIQTNWLAAQKLSTLGIPCVYRSQGEPRERIIETPKGDLFLNYQQRKLMSRAELKLEPSAHHGLGLEAYTTATSPIRRYLDLVIQRQLVAAIRGEPSPYSSQDLKKILMESEELLGQAIQVEQARQRYWLLRYLENRRGEETPAFVLSQYGNRIQLLLTEFMLECSVPAASYSWLQKGQEITVRIGRARPLEDELRVEPC